MKIRIKGNSLRLRLSQSEVSLISRQGKVVEYIKFPDTTLTYELISHPGNEIEAAYVMNKITVSVPQNILERWSGTDEVGFDSHISINDHESLYILVEKDFKCYVERGEDESDLFDPPS